MAVPPFDQFLGPVLNLLNSTEGGLRSTEVYKALATQFELSEEDRAERLKSGMLKYQNRILWAVEYLKKNEFLEKPSRGLYLITPAGRVFLAEHTSGIQLSDLPDSGKTNPNLALNLRGEEVSEPLMVPSSPSQATPEERIESALAEIRIQVASELLQRLRTADPGFFERAVLDLLSALGFAEGGLKHSGRTGDGGIDGIAYMDRLRLEKVYVQAKRWTGTVGRPEIQAFYGALAGHRAQRGVFFTTSTYTREAQEYAQQVSDALVLIDGPRIAELMIECGIGVSLNQSLVLPRLDSDYFEE